MYPFNEHLHESLQLQTPQTRTINLNIVSSIFPLVLQPPSHHRMQVVNPPEPAAIRSLEEPYVLPLSASYHSNTLANLLNDPLVVHLLVRVIDPIM